MEFRELHPGALAPVNAPTPEKVARLVARMKEEGWKGRSLLVEETDTRYFAWTGSNRIPAALEAGLARVPCEVITHDEAQAAFSSAGFILDGFQSWRDAVTRTIGKRDEARLGGLLRAGFRVAAEMLLDEIKSEEG